MRRTNRHDRDLVVYLSLLATATLLTLCGVPPSSLATIGVALSGLYRAWTSPRRSGTEPADQPQPTYRTAEGSGPAAAPEVARTGNSQGSEHPCQPHSRRSDHLITAGTITAPQVKDLPM
jgi:hypothetical protein